MDTIKTFTFVADALAGNAVTEYRGPLTLDALLRVCAATVPDRTKTVRVGCYRQNTVTGERLAERDAIIYGEY